MDPYTLESQEHPLVVTDTREAFEPATPPQIASLKKIGLAAVLATACAAVFVMLDAGAPEASGRSSAEFQTVELQEDFQHPFSIWQSAEHTGDKLSRKPVGYFKSDFSFSGPEVVISNVQGQVIEGFGGAFTESSAAVYKKLSNDQRDQFIEDYFSVNGLGYTLGRTHINSCDFSISSYSFDDHDGDVGLTMFDTSLEHDKEELLPLIWAAQYMIRAQGSGRELKMLASPWSPPAWMKDQSWNPGAPVMDHSGKPCLKHGMEQVWANYIAKWIQSYRAHGVPIWGMTVQNEPLNNASWKACLMSSKEEADFVANHLGPVIRELVPDVQIFIYDHKDQVANYALDVLANSVAGQYVAGVAYHWYSGDGWDQLDRLQAENQSLREKLLRLGHSPAELQGLTAQSKSPRGVRVVRPSAQEIQQARDFLTSKYPDRCAFPKATSGESRLRDLLRSKLELQTCQEEVKKLEMEGDAMRLQLHKASEAIRKADAEALAWRQARREVLQGGDAASASLKLAQASLLQKREQLKVLRLEVRRGQLSPAIQGLKHVMGGDSLLRDVLHRWCHIALWSSRRPSEIERRAMTGEQADTLETTSSPLATLELVPQSFTAEGSIEVALVARVEQQVHRTDSQRLRGKATWLENHFKFEAFSWNSTLDLEVLALGSGDPDTLGCTSVDFLSLTPGKWHVLKERVWGSTCGRLEVWAFVTMCPPSPPEVVIADTMPKPTQRELQKMHLQELVREEAAVPQTSKASREGKSQRELQRKELESLLESPTHEKQKEAKMKSLEAKIAEMQAELEAMKSAGTSARQKRDQKRMERHGNVPMTGIDKFRSAGKRLAEPSKAEIETTATAFGFNFEDLFKLGQEVMDEGTSEEYNIYGDSDNEEKFAQRVEEAQKIIAQEKERMEGGLLGRMRKGVTAGGARERAARRKGKRGEAKDVSPAPKSKAAEPAPAAATSVSPRRTTSPQPVSVFGFNFELPELLAFGQDGDDAASEVHNVYGSDTEEMQAQRTEDAKNIMSQEKDRLEGMARGRMRQGLVAAGGARERMAKRKGDC